MNSHRAHQNLKTIYDLCELTMLTVKMILGILVTPVRLKHSTAKTKSEMLICPKRDRDVKVHLVLIAVVQLFFTFITS